MDFSFIIGQLFGIARVGTASYSYKTKNQQKNAFWKTISSGLYALQYLVLGFTSGAAVMGVSAARSLAFYFLHKKGVKPKKWMLLAFTAIGIGAGIATWKDAWSLAPILASGIVTYGQWQKDIKISNKSLTAGNIVLAICNLFKGAYVDFAGTALISAVGITKDIRDKHKTKIEVPQNKKEPELEVPKKEKSYIREKVKSFRKSRKEKLPTNRKTRKQNRVRK